MWLCVGRASREVELHVFKEYFALKLGIPESELLVDQLKTVRRANCFEVGFSKNLYSPDNALEFWPEGIVFRLFYFTRQPSIQRGYADQSFSR